MTSRTIALSTLTLFTLVASYSFAQSRLHIGVESTQVQNSPGVERVRFRPSFGFSPLVRDKILRQANLSSEIKPLHFDELSLDLFFYQIIHSSAAEVTKRYKSMPLEKIELAKKLVDLEGLR